MNDKYSNILVIKLLMGLGKEERAGKTIQNLPFVKSWGSKPSDIDCSYKSTA